MLRFALCDDKEPQRKLTRALLEDYALQHALSFQIYEFASSSALLNTAREQLFDFYLLDVILPEIDGIQLGMALRKRDSDGVIVYLCGSPDFALEGYRVRAFSYLLKPLRKDLLFAVLDDAAALLEKREKCVIVRTADGCCRLRLDAILYVELIRRAPHYYLSSGSCVAGTTIRSSFQDAVRPLLEDPRFLLCGSSFLLSLHHIQSITKTAVLFDGGRWAAVPRRAVPSLQKAWNDYWLDSLDTGP